MQFKRYEAWTKGLNLIVWLCCLIVVALGVRIAIIQGDFTFFLISIAVSCLSSLWVFVSARLAARAVDKGSLKDYLIVNEKEIKNTGDGPLCSVSIRQASRMTGVSVGIVRKFSN